MAQWKSATIRCDGISSYSVGSFKILNGRELEEEDKKIVDKLRGVKGLIIVDHYDTSVDEVYKDDDLEFNKPQEKEKTKVTRKLRPKNG